MGIIGLILGIAPLVVSGIHLIETLITGKGKGPEKKAAVIEAVQKAYVSAESEKVLGKDLQGIKAEDLGDATGMLIDFFVSIMNSVGVLHHTVEDPTSSGPGVVIDSSAP